jgi:multicomponent Na+:H+ antiporter subunit C
MMEFIRSLINNYYYLVSILLFLIGFHTMLTHSNLIKKVIGMNIMETSIFLFFVAIGYVDGKNAPIIDEKAVGYINPLPSALILTGLVVGVSLTAFSLSLIVKLYKYYGTLDADEIMRIRSQEE